MPTAQTEQPLLRLGRGDPGDSGNRLMHGWIVTGETATREGPRLTGGNTW